MNRHRAMMFGLVTFIAGLALTFTATSDGLAVGITKAEAACNAVCREKCRRTAHFGGLTVQQCIAKWAVINQDPALARRLERKARRIRRSKGYE